MKFFTSDNTDGFTDSELDTLNEAAWKLIQNPDDTEEVKAVCDAVNNAWTGGATVDDLINAVVKRDARARLSAHVNASGLSIAEFARTVLGRDERTVRRWLTGEIDVPESAAVWLQKAAVEVNSRTVTVRVPR